MLDRIFEALFSILDVAATIVGEENMSPFFKILGCLVWLLLVAGVIGPVA